MRTLINVLVLMMSGLVILSGCDTVTTLLQPAVKPAADSNPTTPTAAEAQPTSAPAMRGFMFYNSYAAW